MLRQGQISFRSCKLIYQKKKINIENKTQINSGPHAKNQSNKNKKEMMSKETYGGKIVKQFD